MGMNWTSLLTLVFGATLAMAANPPVSDTLETRAGNLRITPVGHATLMLEWQGLVIHVDPQPASTALAKADLILITHEHGDHLDSAAIGALSKTGTRLIYTAACARKLPGGEVLANGEQAEFQRIVIEAIPAYNILHERAPQKPFHPKGEGNGYLLTLGGLRLYLAGDSENTPEMKGLKNIDIAFLPMNLPYTMTPEMVADAARSIRPRILYPYHFGDTDPAKLVALLAGEKGIEVRIRDLK